MTEQNPASVGVALQPLTPLKIGHMHNVIAAGHLNNQVLTDEETGERLLIKGRSYKTTAAAQYEETLPDGRLSRRRRWCTGMAARWTRAM